MLMVLRTPAALDGGGVAELFVALAAPGMTENTLDAPVSAPPFRVAVSVKLPVLLTVTASDVSRVGATADPDGAQRDRDRVGARNRRRIRDGVLTSAVVEIRHGRRHARVRARDARRDHRAARRCEAVAEGILRLHRDRRQRS